jgi:hypothetical protein
VRADGAFGDAETAGDLRVGLAGGEQLLAIRDFTAISDRPVDEPFPALFSALMLAWTQQGEAHSCATYRRLLAEAGLEAPAVSDSLGSPARFLITSRQGATAVGH